MVVKVGRRTRGIAQLPQNVSEESESRLQAIIVISLTGNHFYDSRMMLQRGVESFSR